MTYINLEDMMKKTNILRLIILFSAFVYFYGCTSGEYEVEQYNVKYTEKTVKIDTIKKVTFDDKIKQDKNNFDNIKDPGKDSYTYTIQIGAFAMNDNSERFTEMAKQILGDGVYTEMSSNLHKIRIGRWNNRAEASKYIEYLRTKGYLDAFIITKRN